MGAETPRAGFDLFISYAHADDRDENREKVSALVEAIRDDYLRVIGAPLNVFFDTHAIHSMDDWEAKILTGLRDSRMMAAVLSPNYFQSDFCRREWEIYVETELAQALPGDGITPIYVVKHPAFEADPVEEQLRHWIKDLRRRQYIEWLPFWPEGAKALEREDVRRRLASLPGQIAERLKRAAVRDASPNTVPLPSVHFVGRRDEMHTLLNDLIVGQIGAITAVHGIPGIGKSMLAFAYAWGYGYKYPGGRFLISAANLTDLAGGVIALAEPKGVALGDEERKSPETALAKVKAAFETGPPALIVIDNIDNPALLRAPARERALPKGDHIHVLVTTRVSPDDLPRIRCLPLDALQTDDAMALLQSFRPIADSPQDDEWKAALEAVRRLGGHALAVEVVAVFLRENPGITHREFAKSLERDGITLLEEEVGPEASGRLAWHAESCIGRLLEPTLAALSPSELRAVEFAALLPPDNLPLPWIHDLLLADFPDLARTGLRDPLPTLMKRLERLRLVVPQVQQRGAVPELASGLGGERLARMHRLVQDVVRQRFDPEGGVVRKQMVHRYADNRGDWLKIHWGQPGLVWELPSLRDLALQRIDEGDRGGYLLADNIAKPLLHTGRMLDVRELWRRSEAMFVRLYEAAPENAKRAWDLANSYERLGDLALIGGDSAEARRYCADGLAILERLSAAAPNNAVYARALSLSYMRLGDLALMSAGDPEGARRCYADGLTISERLSDGAPGNAEYAGDLAFFYQRLGGLALSAGDEARARRYFEDSLTIRKRLSDAASDNPDYASILSFSYISLGDLAASVGDRIGARRFYEACLTIRKRLSGAAPENADYAWNLSGSYSRLGDLARSGGDPAGARRYYADGLTILERLSQAAPENADYARDLSISYDRLGDLAMSSGDAASAHRFYENGLEIRKRLSGAAPENADYARNLSVSFEKLGYLAEAVGDTIGARRSYEDCLSIRKRLTDAAQENAGYARDLSVIYERLGYLAASGRDPAGARRYYEACLTIQKRLSDAAPESPDYARDLSAKYERLGDVAVSGGDPAAARRYYEDCLTIRKRLSCSAPKSTDYARDLSISYDRLGDLSVSEGDLVRARRYYAKGLRIRRRLSAAAPRNADYARGVLLSYSRLGSLAVSRGDSMGARRYYVDCLAIAKRLSDAAPDNANYARDLWVSYWKLAELAEVDPNKGGARRWWRRAYDVLSGSDARVQGKPGYSEDAGAWLRRAHDILAEMKQRGMSVSTEDQEILHHLEAKLGLK
ncbi:MAG: tetratricopeptide repeat protein [Isosphaerales bacterium]